MIKKLIFIKLLLFIGPIVFAPNYESVAILRPQPVKPFDKLIYAIGMTETKCDTFAFNMVERAVGYFQIRPIRVEDYNIRTGSNYKLFDMFNYDIAEKVFLYYAMEVGPYNFEKIARNWNGSGPRTQHYWNRVKTFL